MCVQLATCPFRMRRVAWGTNAIKEKMTSNQKGKICDLRSDFFDWLTKQAIAT